MIPSETAALKWEEGDPVWYRQTCRGGYGFQRDAPAEFVRVTGHRVTVRVWLTSGEQKQIVVHQKNIRRRVLELADG